MGVWGFVVWMLGYPLVAAVIDYLNDSSPFAREFSSGVRAMSALTHIVIWFWVGSMLWKRGKS